MVIQIHIEKRFHLPKSSKIVTLIPKRGLNPVSFYKAEQPEGQYLLAFRLFFAVKEECVICILLNSFTLF